MNSEEIKAQSKKLTECAKNYGYDIKHSHALEIISKINNDTNWHVSSKVNPNKIETGFKEIDSKLIGGIQKGTLTGIVGLVNSGKTRFCLSIVAHNLKQKKKVLLVLLDGHKNNILQQLISYLTDIPLDKINNNNLSEKEQILIVRTKSKIINKYLIIKEFNEKKCSIDQISSVVFDVKSEFNFELLCFDYIQMLYQADIKHESKNVLNMIFKMASAYNCAIISPIQASSKQNVDTKQVDDVIQYYSKIIMVEKNKNPKILKTENK